MNGRHDWRRVSQCLWASATSIRGKTALNDLYADLKDFFVTSLGVAELNLTMVHDELIEKGAARQASVAEIKETLQAFTSLLPSENPPPSPKKILESRIFPVRYPNGQVELRTSRVEFAIVDRQRLGDAFSSKAQLLDFTLDEVRQLRPFLRWAGLERRYLSRTVKEISRVEGGDPTRILDQDRSVSRKAHGLFR